MQDNTITKLAQAPFGQPCLFCQ